MSILNAIDSKQICLIKLPNQIFLGIRSTDKKLDNLHLKI